ncbi:uncharacterized protein LOC110761533 [Prunus avium]|uniref:Uncharacterized protein LOC110761533 n=1 Tax=Prunus avium TaxID=42229 RepID=A0A6P5T0L4_PRUAV|nr:uncharacterized protein LOC110761533 [Prunus avium]
MVFNSVSSRPETIPEPAPKPDSMASIVPSKSLVHQAQNHGLPLPQLKWAMSNNTTTTTKSNETNKTSAKSSENNNPSLQLSSNTKFAQLDPVAKQPEPKFCNVEKEADPLPATEVIDGPETQKPKSTAEDKKSKICIRIRSKEKAAVVPEPEPEPEQVNEKESSVAAALAALEDEETIQKTWNLRPRRPVPKANGRAGALKTGAPLVQQNKTQVAGGSSKAGAKDAQKDNKLKISVSLTKEEIEEDIFIMTGARPSRRPKKRAKNVQKQLDHLFPGLWLNSVSTNSYQVPETPLKRI